MMTLTEVIAQRPERVIISRWQNEGAGELSKNTLAVYLFIFRFI